MRLSSNDCSTHNLPDSWKIPIGDVQLRTRLGKPWILGEGAFGKASYQAFPPKLHTRIFATWPALIFMNSITTAFKAISFCSSEGAMFFRQTFLQTF